MKVKDIFEHIVSVNSGMGIIPYAEQSVVVCILLCIAHSPSYVCRLPIVIAQNYQGEAVNHGDSV